MKKKLEQITNLTINDLLNNEIILPSLYFDKFYYHAKQIEINLDDDDFNKELNQLIVKDFTTIEEYMKIILDSTVNLQGNVKDAKTAILNKDDESLNDVYKKMLMLQDEIESLSNKLFIDDITNTYNRKWIYSKLLDTNTNFKDNGICVLLSVLDYCYLQKEYGELLANNLLIFTINFISQKLKDENYDFQISKYLDNKFFIFISNEEKQDVLNKILNIEQLLSNTTLKSHSGLLIKAKYAFKLNTFEKDTESEIIFRELLDQEKEV